MKVRWLVLCVLGLCFGGHIAGQSTPPDHAMKMPMAEAKAVELDGCFTTSDGLMPKLTLFRSEKFYRVEPRGGLLIDQPLAFANNENALVHVTGHVADASDIYDPDHGPVLIVDSIEQLAPTCNVTTSLAELRENEEAPQGPPRNTPVVEMKGEELKFFPARVEIKVGQTVLWKNSSLEVHTVTADPHQALKAKDVTLPAGAAPFDSGFLSPGKNYQHTFTKPGIYRYVCTLHEAQGMIGEVVVKP